MAGQSRYVNFDDSLKRKFIEEFLNELLHRNPRAGCIIAIDRPEVPYVQHKAAGYQCGHEPEKMRNWYCAGRKIRERRHLQKKERRSPIRSTTLLIYRLLDRCNIFGHYLGA